jgi:hypothetical protein
MRVRAAVLAVSLTGAAPAQEAPQSAIPWLSDSLRVPAGMVAGGVSPANEGEGVSVSVLPRDATRRDATGLRPAAAAGLPRDLWAGSDPARLRGLLDRQPPGALPAVQDLLHAMLLAEFEPPRAAPNPDALFLARIDTLLRLGALEPALALLEQAGATDPEGFRRWWDASLLTGFDERACAAMTANAGIAPSLPARIFCLSRTGDWAAAALTLDVGRALDLLDEGEEALLAQFLDPESFEGEAPPDPPRPMTPLAFRLLDGIGETPGTRDLPLAFAASDLRPLIGWKARIEAAERLARVGAVPPETLFALYLERAPSASGGVWDRAAAVQRLEEALAGGTLEADGAPLSEAVARMGEADLLIPLAETFGPRLTGLVLEEAREVDALRLGLLSRDPEAAARAADRWVDAGGEGPFGALDRFAVDLALGRSLSPPDEQLARAVADGFTGPPPERLTRMRESGRLGEALLETFLSLEAGAESDPRDVADALAFLRAAGLEAVARRTALQLLLA